MHYHTIKTGKINRKPEKNGKKGVRNVFFREKTAAWREKTENSG